MAVNPKHVGEQIFALRKSKGITQNELGERLCVSPQAVSKWERGETLPDTALLPDLANVLETSVDNLLCGCERQIAYKRKVTVAEAAEGIACFERIGELLGRDSYFYLGAIEGVDRKMNIEFEQYLSDSYTREAMIAEAIIQCILNGAYVDPSDVRKNFIHSHWIDNILKYTERYGIK
ncbi:MAG: helix-turn-helix domain-containing protein [Eubacteriales bacterium]